ncbi:MAG: DUF1553 domain-containing protein [Zavarzinella sp.]
MLEAEQQIAETGLAVARAEMKAVEKRVQAWQSIWANADPAQRQSSHNTAILADRELSFAKAKHALVIAQSDMRVATPDKQAVATKAVQSMHEALKKAEAALTMDVKPTDRLPEFVGARWTATRFRSSGADDPTPKFLPQSTGRRTALAQWITDRRNPLTARVAVNHLWTRHFGAPLVPTIFDFGRNGQPPTHPELLDWLASELIDSGWDMKHLHRLIVQSATYRLASTSSTMEKNNTTDPENRFLWRWVPIRIESQLVRDSILSLADNVDTAMGGPSIPQPQQAASNRRSIYFFHSNNERNLFLTMFDEALVSDCYRREQSIVPQQALALTNSRLVLDQSRLIADRITHHLKALNQPVNDQEFARAAYMYLLASPPNNNELSDCIQALAEWRKLPEAGKEPDSTATARTNLVWVLINHNDFISIR